MNFLLVVKLSMPAVKKVLKNVDREAPDYRKPLQVHAAFG